MEELHDEFIEGKTEPNMVGKNDKVGNTQVPFFIQVCEKLLEHERLVLIPASENTHQAFILQDGKYRKISNRELKTLCKNILRQYLNLAVYQILEEDQDCVYVGGIAVSADVLKDARKGHFALSRECRQELRDMVNYTAWESYTGTS
jgi:hypothetical protein